MMFTDKNLVTKILGCGFLAIMALLPFHAFLSTWAISNFNHELLFKSWKEALLVGIILPLTCYVVARQPDILKKIWQRTVNKLIFAYAALNVLLVLVFDNAAKAEISGLVFNLRFFAMFLLAQVLLELLPLQKLKNVALKIVFVGGLIVVAFGSLQVLLLPADFLRHFGYSSSIIPPYFTVDSNESLVRMLSTLRGPNALGAYLVFWLPILAFVTQKLWARSQNWQIWTVLVWAASLITLYGSRSRSAWLAVIISLSFFAFIQMPRFYKKQLLIGLAVASIAFLAVATWQWNSVFIQSTLLHRDPNELSSINSDEQRTGSITDALNSIVNNPFGQGPGSAGLASTYGNNPNIIENYYLQVAVELGLLGLALLLAITTIVLNIFWRQRHDGVSLALLAGFIGLLVVNLLLPAWGDETVSMLWWGMAGIWAFAQLDKKPKKRAKIR